MQYMRLNADEREQLLAALANMPEYLRDMFSGLTREQARSRQSEDAFSPVEQVWHLADLEREGFGERIRRLLLEIEPRLPDFDGTRIAAERNYRALSVAAGLHAFTEARRANLARLRSIDAQSWLRRGTQEGVGEVSLCDMPDFMAQHDAAHRAEIDAWRKSAAQ